jgi:hypothetical protein
VSIVKSPDKKEVCKARLIWEWDVSLQR